MAKVNTRSPYDPQNHGPREPVLVRAARPEDAEAIAPIDVEREATPAEELVPRIIRALEQIRDGDLAYTCVALDDERIVGYGKCRYMSWSERTEDPAIPDGWYLTGVEVLRSHRRRGIGRALTVHRLDWLRARADVAYFFTGEGNLPSRDLHEQLGFVEIASGLALPLPPPFSNEELHILSKLTFAALAGPQAGSGTESETPPSGKRSTRRTLTSDGAEGIP